MIELKNVSFHYDVLPIFSNYSLTLPDHGITAILGSSGSGKTTLLRLICRLLHPDEGQIIAPSPASVVFQESRLIPWLTIAENVRAPLPKKTDITSWLHLVELDGFENKYPNELSGGQLRRAALARALAFRAPLLALDEPFTGLDSPLSLRLMKIIKEQSKERPVLLVTHNETLSAFFDYTVLVGQ